MSDMVKVSAKTPKANKKKALKLLDVWFDCPSQETSVMAI